MLDMDNRMTHIFVERGKFLPLGQALPIHMSPVMGQNGRQNWRQDSRKEAYVY